MSRIKTDLRPSISKMTIKGTLPSIHHDREKFLTETVKGQGLDLSPSQVSAGSLSRRKQNEKRDNTDHLLKEIEVRSSLFLLSGSIVSDKIF